MHYVSKPAVLRHNCIKSQSHWRKSWIQLVRGFILITKQLVLFTIHWHILTSGYSIANRCCATYRKH